MATTVQISHDQIRGEQLAEIMQRRPEIPRDPGKAATFLLFEYYDKLLGVKATHHIKKKEG